MGTPTLRTLRIPSGSKMPPTSKSHTPEHAERRHVASKRYTEGGLVEAILMKYWTGVLLTSALCLAGCGKAEKREAVTFYKALSAKSADFTNTNALEKDLLGSTKAWCESITNNGAGRESSWKKTALRPLPFRNQPRP